MLGVENFILARLKKNHESNENQRFSIPLSAFLISFQKDDPNGSEYCLYELKNYEFVHRFAKNDLNEVEQYATTQANYRVSASHLSHLGYFSTWSQNHTFCIYPLNLLAQPKAFILFPEEDLAEDNHLSYINELNLILERAMFDYLLQRYNVAKLQEFTKSQDLLLDFAHAVAHWICPHTYEVFGQKHFYWNNDETNEDPSALLHLVFEEIESQIQFFINPFLLKDEGHAHGFDTRKFALQQSLAIHFKTIYGYWEALKLHSTEQILSSLLHKIEKLSIELEAYKTKIGDALESIRTSKPELHVYQYAFFAKGGLWYVHFEGEEYTKKAASDRGMVAIHILLKNPGVKFSPRELQDKVNEALGKAPTNEEVIYLDSAIMKDIGREYKRCLTLWKEIKDFTTKEINQEQYTNLQNFLELIKIKRNYIRGKKAKELTTLEKKVTEKINMVKNYGGLADQLFQHFKEAKYKTERMDKDLLYRNIDNALDLFKGTNLFYYFNETLIYKTKNGFHPFIFVPKFSEKEGLKAEWLMANWVTE